MLRQPRPLIPFTFGRSLATASLFSGLVGWYRMDESSWSGAANEVVDSSGSGNHGTAGGSATTTTGKFGNGGDFSSSGRYVDLGSPAAFNFGSGDFTYACWIKTTNFAAIQRVIAKDANGTPYRALSLLTSKVAQFACRDSSNNNLSASGTTIVADGNWHHLVGVRNGSSALIYVDGVQDGTGTNASTGDTNISTSTRIAARNAASPPYYVGLIDDARIYNRALTATEVALLYNLVL